MSTNVKEPQMTTNSISAAMERTRKHIVQRRLKAQGVFMDGVVTADEMKRLRDDFNEAYYFFRQGI